MVASLLITYQSAIFAGIMTRTYSFLTDVGLPDIWVVDQQVQYIEDIKPLQDAGKRFAFAVWRGSNGRRRCTKDP